MIGDLTDSQIDHLLRTEVVGRIGCYDGERIYVVPISYVYDEGFVYGHSALGMKIDMMRQNPKVCFEIEHVDDLANWQSIIVWGTYEELEGEEANMAMSLLVARLSPLIPEKGGRLPHPWNEHGGSVEHILHRASRHGIIYRIRVADKTGRYETR